MKRKILLITVSAIALISILGISAIYKIGDIVIEKAVEAEFSNILSDSNNNNLYLEGELEVLTVKNTSEITEIDSRKEPFAKTEAGVSVPSNNKLTSGSEKKDIKAEDNKTLSPGNEIKAGENKIPPEKIEEIRKETVEMNNCKADSIDSIQNISAVSQETAASSEEANASTEEQLASIEHLASLAKELGEVASRMKESISVFKI